MNLIQLEQEYLAHTYARFPLCLVQGSGAVLKDETGREYIDLGSGIAVNTFGAADPEWQQAVIEQLGKLQHASNLYYTEPNIRLAQMLCEKTGMKKVFFSNSGAEANECAIKAARKYAAQTLGSDYTTIITLEHSFHGRTITTLAATGQAVFHQQFQPLTPGFVHARPNDAEHLEQLLNQNKCAAILLEVVQGEGGVNALDVDYVQQAAKLANQYGALLIVDEVQSGNGRTGKLYGYMHYNIQPDLVTTAKGLGGGLPIGATLFGERVQNVYTPGDQGSTFGGNPVSCAGALNILQRLDDDLMQQVQQKSEYIRNALHNAPGVRSVSGLGLMLGVDTLRDASQVVQECMEQGVLVLKAKDKIRLLPPLNIPNNLLEQAIETLKQVCAKQE